MRILRVLFGGYRFEDLLVLAVMTAVATSTVMWAHSGDHPYRSEAGVLIVYAWGVLCQLRDRMASYRMCAAYDVARSDLTRGRTLRFPESTSGQPQVHPVLECAARGCGCAPTTAASPEGETAADPVEG